MPESKKPRATDTIIYSTIELVGCLLDPDDVSDWLLRSASKPGLLWSESSISYRSTLSQSILLSSQPRCLFLRLFPLWEKPSNVVIDLHWTRLHLLWQIILPQSHPFAINCLKGQSDLFSDEWHRLCLGQHLRVCATSLQLVLFYIQQHAADERAKAISMWAKQRRRHSSPCEKYDPRLLFRWRRRSNARFLFRRFEGQVSLFQQSIPMHPTAIRRRSNQRLCRWIRRIPDEKWWNLLRQNMRHS